MDADPPHPTDDPSPPTSDATPGAAGPAAAPQDPTADAALATSEGDTSAAPSDVSEGGASADPEKNSTGRGPQREIDDALTSARAGAAEGTEPSPGSSSAEAAPPSESAPASAVPLGLPDFAGDASGSSDRQDIAMLNDVKLDVKIELGRTNMLIEDVLKLGEGSVVELEKLAGDPVDVLVNDRLVARGEVLVLNDTFCVRISEILAGSPSYGAGIL